MVRIIVTFAVLAASIYAELFPSTVTTHINGVGEQSVSVASPFPVEGMSGVVVHDYGNELHAISAYVVKEGEMYRLVREEVIAHEKIPLVKTDIQEGDVVIGGYLYHNVLLIAPDAATYRQITQTYSKHWIHPDLFALYLASEGESVPTKELLRSFAKKHHIGLVLIVQKGRLVTLDPISGQYVGSTPFALAPTQGMSPFYTRLKPLDSGWFSSSKQNDYYTIMQEL